MPRPHMMLTLGLALAVGLSTSAQAQPRAQTTVTYQASDENFANPERGLYLQQHGWNKSIHPDWESLSLETMQQARADGMTTLRVYYVINEFRSKPLSQAMLDQFAQQLGLARTAGVKLIPLFAYAYPKTDDYPNHPNRPENQDAPVDIIVGHIGQLKPIIRANADVIANWDAGFVGPWGEWHHSTNNLIGTAVRWDEVNDKSRQIVAALLDALPPERMMTLRYPRHKHDLYGDTPLSAAEAYQQTPRARVGAKNDCFLASYDDWGTYVPDDVASIQRYKDFLHQDNQFLPQGGETCNDAADAQPYIGCTNALKELAYMRWSHLNVGYHEGVLQGWKNGGCYDTVAKKLGYRFRLINATIPASTAVGTALGVKLQMANDGWARPYNPRNIELVLRNSVTNAMTRVPINQGDARLLLPGPGETVTLTLTPTLPANLAPGSYTLLLNLPDPAPRLNARPEYSIHLANQNIWESATGYNKLNATVNITNALPASARALLPAVKR